MSPPAARTTAAKRAEDAPPLDLNAPKPNADETITMTVVGVGTVWTLHSSRTEHRIVCRTKDGERQVVEYPWDEWLAAARYVAACVNREYVKAGVAPSETPVYCGDCGDRATRLANGRASCPVHGEAG